MTSPLNSARLKPRFKCLVTFNRNKYSIIVDNDLNEMTFSDVLNEIRKQIETKPEFSHETHTFEIFDPDFNEYVVITSDHLVIENLSRIRILPKCKSKWSQTENQDITNDNKTLDTIASKTFKPINAMAVTPFKPSVTSLPVTVTPFTFKLMTSANTTTSSVTTMSQPNTSLTNIKDTVMTNITPNDITSTSLETKSESKFRCHALLAQFVHRFNDVFVANPHNQTNAWQMVSNEMIKNGFKGYSGVVCKREFNNMNSVYVQTLQTATNYKNACAKYQLFAKLNTMDLWPFMNPTTYSKVNKLKESKFGIKPNTIKSPKAVQVFSQPLLQNPIEIKPVTENKILENQQHYIETENVDNKMEQSLQIDETVVRKTVRTIPKLEKIVTVHPNVKQESVDRQASENTCQPNANNDLVVKAEPESHNVSVRPKSKSPSFELPQSAINSVLIACVKRHQGSLCDVKVPLENVWLNVSANMKDFHCPQKYCTPEYCKEQFNNLLSQMVAVLQFADTLEDARNMFSLFDELSSINLKRLLSKKTIDDIASLKKQPGPGIKQNCELVDQSDSTLSIDSIKS